MGGCLLSGGLSSTYSHPLVGELYQGCQKDRAHPRRVSFFVFIFLFCVMTPFLIPPFSLKVVWPCPSPNHFLLCRRCHLYHLLPSFHLFTFQGKEDNCPFQTGESEIDRPEYSVCIGLDADRRVVSLVGEQAFPFGLRCVSLPFLLVPFFGTWFGLY